MSYFFSEKNIYRDLVVVKIRKMIRTIPNLSKLQRTTQNKIATVSMKKFSQHFLFLFSTSTKSKLGDPVQSKVKMSKVQKLVK